jgi:hypothetical protein
MGQCYITLQFNQYSDSFQVGPAHVHSVAPSKAVVNILCDFGMKNCQLLLPYLEVSFAGFVPLCGAEISWELTVRG